MFRHLRAIAKEETELKRAAGAAVQLLVPVSSPATPPQNQAHLMHQAHKRKPSSGWDHAIEIPEVSTQFGGPDVFRILRVDLFFIILFIWRYLLLPQRVHPAALVQELGAEEQALEGLAQPFAPELAILLNKSEKI